MDQYVCKFQISMHDLVLVDLDESFHYLLQDQPSFKLSEFLPQVLEVL